MGRERTNEKRISGRFVALPLSVLQTAEYHHLSHAAKHLLTIVTAGYTNQNNGRLVATPKHLIKFGWRSADSTTRCVEQLLASGLLIQTRIGMRPNRAAWYALAWRPLDQTTDIEIDPAKFRRFIGTSLAPAIGEGKPEIAPAIGVRKSPPSPAIGAIRGKKSRSLLRLSESV